MRSTLRAASAEGPIYTRRPMPVSDGRWVKSVAGEKIRVGSPEVGRADPRDCREVRTHQPRCCVERVTAAPELFQVLSKGVQLQRAHPSQPILPILVCRRAHQTLFWMAKQLGFMVIEMNRQFAGTGMTPEEVLEIRAGLDFDDLHHGTGPSLRVRERLEGPIVSTAIDVTYTWKRTTHDLGDLITAVRDAKPRSAERDMLMDDLRDASLQRKDRGGW